MEHIRYVEAGFDCNDFVALSNEMEVYLDRAIGGAEKRERYKEFNHLNTLDYIIIAYAGDVPAGCAALRKYSEKEIEVKRVFVREGYRKNGVASGIMRRLIAYAAENEYDKLLLETGEFLKESVRLYTDFGFHRIPNYGVYAGIEESLCMELNLTGIRYSVQRDFGEEQLKELFASVNWLSADYTDRMVKAFRNTGIVVSAWKGNSLIGLADALDDGELIAYIHYLLIKPEYQKQGIGRKLLQMVKEHYKNYLYRIVISEEQKNVEFYEKCGFTAMDMAVPLHILNL